MPTSSELILDYNQGRMPEFVALKLKKMAGSPFVFLRGSCHLFYQRLARRIANQPASVFRTAPASWCCGDLHLENFGSYKGDNRQTYFDINDFDEAALAPCTWDLVRFLTSLHVADTAQIHDEAAALSKYFVQTYAAELATGKARWVERETASGLIGDLLTSLRQRKRKAQLDSRTDANNGSRTIRADKVKAAALVDQATRQSITRCIESLNGQIDNYAAHPNFFKVIDIADRIAGTGSLGLPRYLILVEGKGSPDQNHLLDLKTALSSSLAVALKGITEQPDFGSPAQRIVTLQQRLQAIPMAFLRPQPLEGQPFVLRALQPSEDRVSLDKAKPAEIKALIAQMAKLTAWMHLRGSGRQGAATVDALAAFGQQVATWQDELLETAEACAKETSKDFVVFLHDYQNNFFATLLPTNPA
jgi:uncharacterized protein (DUF2252 family)